MKTVITRLVILLAIVAISISPVMPAFAWTGAYTGWHNNFDAVYAQFSMFLANYYEDNTSATIKLGWSYFYIDNWGTHPYGTLGRLRNTVTYANGSPQVYESYPSIAPGEFAVEYLTLGETTYSKQPMGFVMVESLACEGYLPKNGIWEMIFWADSSITTQYYP